MVRKVRISGPGVVQEIMQTGLSSTGIEVDGNDFQDDQKVKA